MKVVFSHGQESGPDGSKIRALAAIAREKCLGVDSLDYRGIHSPEERAEKLFSHIHGQPDTLLVGSSMGGYVSLRAAERQAVKGLFLMAPALFLGGYESLTSGPPQAPALLLHGWQDDIAPPAHSIEFAQRGNCELVMLDADHRFSGAIPVLSGYFRMWLDRYLESKA